MHNNHVLLKKIIISLFETLHATLDSSLTSEEVFDASTCLYFACPDVDKLTNTWVQLKTKVAP